MTELSLLNGFSGVSKLPKLQSFFLKLQAVCVEVPKVTSERVNKQIMRDARLF